MDLVLLTFATAGLGAALALGYLVIRLAHQNGRLLVRMDAHVQQASIEPVPAEAPATDPGWRGAGQLARGEIAPTFSLPNLAGDLVSLEDFRGRFTLVVFWSPGCSHCTGILEEFKEWERAPDSSNVQLLVVSMGSAAAHLGLGIMAPVLLDTGLTVGSTFGATGSPSAVLIDENGRIASTLARGAPHTVALMRRAPHVQRVAAMA